MRPGAQRLQIVFQNLFTQRTGIQKGIAYFPYRTVSADRIGDEIRLLAHFAPGIGNRYPKSARGEGAQIVPVIPDIGDLIGGHTCRLRQLFEGGLFVPHSLQQHPHPEFSRAPFYRRIGASRDPRDLDPEGCDQRQAEAVVNMKPLRLTSIAAVAQSAVRQHTVHIHRKEADTGHGGTRLYRGRVLRRFIVES